MPKQTGGDAAKARSKNATEVSAPPPTLKDQDVTLSTQRKIWVRDRT